MLMLCFVIAWYCVFSFRLYQSLCLSAWLPRFFFLDRRHGKDTGSNGDDIGRVLPESDNESMQWVMDHRKGFAHWRERCDARILPHSILDLLCEKDGKDNTFT
mgnify:CR=1 FL=1